MCAYKIHRKRTTVIVAGESSITECWSQETELDQRRVEIQRTRKRDRGKGRERSRWVKCRMTAQGGRLGWTSKLMGRSWNLSGRRLIMSLRRRRRAWKALGTCLCVYVYIHRRIYIFCVGIDMSVRVYSMRELEGARVWVSKNTVCSWEASQQALDR